MRHLVINFRVSLAGLAACTLLAAACTDGGGAATEDPTTEDPLATVDQTASPGCDDRDEALCLLPWPNDRFTVVDDSTETGRRLAIPDVGRPENVDGVPIDLTDQNRADGFSPASTILIGATDVDVEASGLADSNDIGASLDDNAPITLTDIETDERWPYWAEVDAPAPAGEQLLMVHPARALTEGHRYRVEVDELSDGDTPLASIDLPLNWEFTVASGDSLSGRLRSMVARTGETTPGFEVLDVEAGSPTVVTGTYEIPNFLDNDGSTGGRFRLDDDGLPAINPDAPIATATFTCLLGDEAGPKGTVVFGHGLLGSQDEVRSLAAIADVGGLNACATDWIGMSTNDLPTVAETLADLSDFPVQADRLQQGQVAFDQLGRLVNATDGFGSDPAFQDESSASLLEDGGAVFIGNSQGGILGGAVSAVTDEWDRVVLGVPGIGYNLLLPRSSDWPQFQAVFDEAYTDPGERVLLLELIQLLWDRGENSAYAQHLTTDPYDGLDAKTVLLVQALGDHQVTNVSTEVLARTIGAVVVPDPIDSGRSDAGNPLWDIERLGDFPTTRPVLSVWDFGTPIPPAVNLPPFSPDYGEDPHGAGSNEPGVLQQAITFLTTGEIVDVCSGGPCIGRQIDDG